MLSCDGGDNTLKLQTTSTFQWTHEPLPLINDKVLSSIDSTNKAKFRPTFEGNFRLSLDTGIVQKKSKLLENNFLPNCIRADQLL